MKLPFKIPVAFKNRTAIGAVCVIVAIIVVFVLGPLVTNAVNASDTIVRAKQDIPMGTKITQNMLETVSVGKNGLADNVMHNVADVAGKYAAVSITAEDDITAPKLSDTGGMYDLKDGQQLISIAVKNFADSLSGKIQAGDIVSVLVPPTSNNAISGGAQTEAQCPPELQYVKIAAVTSANGGDTDEAEIKNQASSNNSNNLPATVTLLVNARQAQKLAGYENSSIHFALDCRGNETKAQQLLSDQEQYFEQNSADASDSSDSTVSADTPSAKNTAPQKKQSGTSSNTSTSSLDNSSSLGAVK